MMITKEELENINLALQVMMGIVPKPPIGKREMRTLLDLSDKVDMIIGLVSNPPEEAKEEQETK